MVFKRKLEPEEKTPRKKESTAPPSLQAPPRPRPVGPKHDSLCIETYQESHALTLVDKNRGRTLLDQEPEDIQPLSRCYCTCAACWLPTGKTRLITDPKKKPEGRQTGRCICRSCPCWQDNLRSTEPTPSTRHTSSFKK